MSEQLYRWVKASLKTSGDNKPEGKEKQTIPILYKSYPDVLILIGNRWYWHNTDGNSSDYPVNDDSWSAIEWLEPYTPSPVSGSLDKVGFEFEKYPELTKIIAWFANNVPTPGSEWNKLLHEINNALSKAATSPVSGSLEDAAESEGVKYSLRGVYPTRYSALLNKHSEAAREKYTPFVDGFLAGAFHERADESQMKRLYDWIMDENRKPATTFFTSGWLRNVAKEIEYRIAGKGGEGKHG